jgi:hypothetical protein
VTQADEASRNPVREEDVVNANAYGLLRHLEEHHVAPSGEHALDLEQAADLGLETPEPVMLLTNAALYARAAARSWTRVPLSRIQRVTVATDPSGMLTRYTVAGETGETVVDVALPMARSSFKERMKELADDPHSVPTRNTRPTVTVQETPAAPSAQPAATAVHMGPRLRWAAA